MNTTVRDTSLETYKDIKDENIYDSRMEEVLSEIIKTPLMTGREYAKLLGYNDMNIVRPRISDLKRLGHIIECGKRKCSLGGRTSYVYSTKINIEKHILKGLGFIETQANLFSFNCDCGTILFQDFRNSKRRSYAMLNNSSVDYKNLNVYRKFKFKLNKFLGVKNE